MNENIYKFIKKKKIKKSIDKCDMSTEIIVKEIDVKKFKIDFINMIKEEDVIKEKDIVREDVIKEDIVKEDIIKEDIIKEDIIKEDIKKDIINNIVKKDIVKEKDIIKDIKEDMVNNIIKEDIVKKDMINNKIDNIVNNNIDNMINNNIDNIVNNKINKIDNINKIDDIANENSLSLRDRVLNFKNINKSEIRFTSLDKHLNLPKKYLNLTRIFRVILTIQKYNINRGLSNIFSKCKKCIEDVLKFRVSVDDIEKIRNIIKEDIIIKEVEVDDIKTFTYLLNCTVEDFDKKVWEYYQNNKENNIKEGSIKENIIEENNIKEESIKENSIKEGSIIENIIEENNIKEDSIKENIKKSCTVKENIKKYSNILDRIKEKERLRKEEFIKKSKEEDNSIFLKKIDMYFKKENKTCIKINEIIKVFNLYDGERYLRKLSVKEKLFDIIEISGEEYLIIKK